MTESKSSARSATRSNTPRRHPIYNEVTDNHIHHGGVFHKYVAGVVLGLSQSNIIAHNLIEQMPHHGINLGNCGYGRNIVEYNEVRHVCRETADKGGINVWMEDPDGHVEPQAVRSGHVIRHNLVADIDESPSSGRPPDGEQGMPTFGIYLDNYASNCFVYGNIIVRTGAVGIDVQCGRNNLIENNIIVDTWCAAHFGGWWQPQMVGFMTGNHFCRNIFYSPASAPVLHRHIGFATEPLADAIGRSDYNVLFGRGEPIVVESSSPLSDVDDDAKAFPVWPQVEEVSYTTWRELGFEAHSIVADPLFVDPEHDDYRLQPQSPALKLGFQQIDASLIGPRPVQAG